MSVAKRCIGLQTIAHKGVNKVSTKVSTNQGGGVSTEVSTRVSTKGPSSRFTSSQIAGLEANGKIQDLTDPSSPGLVLRIGRTGTKHWLLRYKWKGEPIRIALGEFPAMTLAQARLKVTEHRNQIAEGIDPRTGARAPMIKQVAFRKKVKREKHNVIVAPPTSIITTDPPTSKAMPHITPPPLGDRYSVRYLAYEYTEHYVLPNRERPEETIRILNKDILPSWGERDARTISPREIIEKLDEIIARGARVMANRTAKMLKQMFKYGIHRSIIEKSPVQLLFRPGGSEKPRDRALSDEEITALVQGVDAVCASPQKAAVIMLLLLTLQRRSSLALAEWKEIDFEKAVWRIPAAHDKMRRGHSLPLTPWALETLNVLKTYAGTSPFVIPTRDGLCAANPEIISRSVTRLQTRFKAIGIASFTVHDLRRTGRTQLAKIGVSKEVAERILNHATEQIEGTYNVYDYITEKRSALQLWEDRLRQFYVLNSGRPKANHVMRELLRVQLERRSLTILKNRMSLPT